MTLDEAIAEWKTKRRRMGCVSATQWLCRRVPGFQPLRKTFYTAEGEIYEHVVAHDGVVEVDLAPYNNGPDD